MHLPLICAATLAVNYPAHAKDPRPRVAVLPFTAMAAPPTYCTRLRNHLTEMLGNLFDARIVEQKTTDQAVRRLCGKPSAWWDCLGKDENLFELGRRLKAKTVVVGRLAAIGKRRVLKLRLADVPAGRVSAEVVNIPAGQEEAVLSRFVVLHKQWFGGQRPRKPPPEQQEPPTQERAWYQKWEVWTIIGTGVAVAAGAVLFATMYPPDETGEPWTYYRKLP
jgi:TolB-like protein